MKRIRILLMCLCLAMTAKACAEERICVSADTAALLTVDGGEVIAPGIYDRIFPLDGVGRYALGVNTKGGMRYALGDESGKALTDAEFSMLCGAEGVILFEKNDRIGAMTSEGEIVVPAEYTQLAKAEDGNFLVMTEDPFDDDADEIFLLNDGELHATSVRSAEGLSAFADGRMPFRDPTSELYGYLDGDGSVALEAQFETAGRFENGRARASKDGKLGAIDPDGNWLIAPEYDYLEIGADVCVALAGRERFVVFDGAGNELFRLEGAGFEASLVGDSPVLRKGDRMYLYAADGSLILETGAETTLWPGLDGQLMLSDGEWGAECVALMNADGSVLERRDQHLIALDGGRYAFMKMDAVGYYSEELEEIRYSCDYDSMRFGMMDAQGNEILPAEYLEIRALGCGRYLAAGEEELKVTDADGNVLWSHLKEE